MKVEYYKESNCKNGINTVLSIIKEIKSYPLPSSRASSACIEGCFKSLADACIMDALSYILKGIRNGRFNKDNVRDIQNHMFYYSFLMYYNAVYTIYEYVKHNEECIRIYFDAKFNPNFIFNIGLNEEDMMETILSDDYKDYNIYNMIYYMNHIIVCVDRFSDIGIGTNALNRMSTECVSLYKLNSEENMENFIMDEMKKTAATLTPFMKKS